MVVFVMSSNPSFLSRGLIIAVFQLFTNMPSGNDVLTNSVMMSIMWGARSLKRLDGNESLSQVFTAMLLITDNTSLLHILLNSCRWCNPCLYGGSYFGCISNPCLILVIFSIKNSENCSATCSSQPG